MCVCVCMSMCVCVCVGSVSLYESDFLPEWQTLAMSCNPAGRSEGSRVVLGANQSHSSAPPQRLSFTHKTRQDSSHTIGCSNAILFTKKSH